MVIAGEILIEFHWTKPVWTVKSLTDLTWSASTIVIVSCSDPRIRGPAMSFTPSFLATLGSSVDDALNWFLIFELDVGHWSGG